MVMTTREVQRTLAVLERLVATLERRSDDLDDEQFRLFQQLHHRQGALRGLLAAREAERSKPIVDLGVWRDGALPAAEPERLLDASVL